MLVFFQFWLGWTCWRLCTGQDWTYPSPLGLEAQDTVYMALTQKSSISATKPFPGHLVRNGSFILPPPDCLSTQIAGRGVFVSEEDLI